MLNATTTTYLDLIGNGKRYRVPPYQRDYSWTEEEWEDLWNDVVDLHREPGSRHYMGAVVVEAESDREFLVIDGQQRLATIGIFTLAVIRKLHRMAERGIDPERNRERAQELRNRFIGEKDPASLVESSRLNLNETDDAFYQDYLVQLRNPHNPRGLHRSGALLWKCFGYFSDRLDELPDVRDDGEALTKVLSETIARRLLFINITVDDDFNAYTVFETLNARGLELTTTDLLKNYLFSKVTATGDLDALKRRWQSLVATVTPQRFSDFLRYHLLCERANIRKQRLFKLVREQIRTPEQVFGLLDALEARAELFAALSDAGHDYWTDLPNAKPFVRELVLFRARQMTPLLFAAWERFRIDTPDYFVRILKLVSIVTFRYSAVSALNPNALESVYHEAARAVLDGNAGAPRAVFDLLRPIYVDDDRFRDDFARLAVRARGQRRKLAKYILCRLEVDARGSPCDHETDPATIEHILPQNPADGWSEDFPPRQWEGAINRLGNLTLLESSRGREIGSAPYARKRPAYERSGYTLTNRISAIAPEAWTLPLLETRQQELASRAVHIWRSDFEG